MLDPLKILADARGPALCEPDDETIGSFAWQVLYNASRHLNGAPHIDSVPVMIYAGIGGFSESIQFYEIAQQRETVTA